MQNANGLRGSVHGTWAYRLAARACAPPHPHPPTLTHLQVLGDAALEHDEANEEGEEHGGTDEVEHHGPLVDVGVVLRPTRGACRGEGEGGGEKKGAQALEGVERGMQGVLVRGAKSY